MLPSAITAVAVITGLGALVAVPAVAMTSWLMRRRHNADDIHRATPVEVVREVPVEVVREQIVYRALPDNLGSYATLVEIMRRLGVEPSNELCWSLGRQAARLHLNHYGVGPRKVSRQKTSGSGTHDFAGYPPEFVPEVERLIIGRSASDAATRDYVMEEQGDGACTRTEGQGRARDQALQANRHESGVE